MDCTGCRDLVEPLFDPELDDGRALGARDLLRAHCRSCPACREHLEDQRRLFACLNTMPREAAPPGFAVAVLARVQERRRHRRRLRGVGVGTAVAAAVAAAGVGLVWKDASVAWLLGGLGHVATWWYSWLHAVVATLSGTVAVDVQHAGAALLRVGKIALEACIVQLLAGWLTLTAAGLVLHACTHYGPRRRVL